MSPNRSQQARAAAIAAELAATGLALPGTLIERHVRCGMAVLRLGGKCLVDSAAGGMTGPAAGELMVEGVQFAGDARGAGVAGGGEGLEAEACGSGGVGLRGAGDGDGELGDEVALVADERGAGLGDGGFEDGHGGARVSGELVAGGGLLGEGAQVVGLEVVGCAGRGDVGVAGEGVGGLLEEGEAVALVAEAGVAAGLLLESEGGELRVDRAGGAAGGGLVLERTPADFADGGDQR